MLDKMPAIEYNVLMSLLSLMKDKFDKTKGNIGEQYGVTKTIKVSPSYPRDLTNFYKPSIIMRKVNTDSQPIGMGGVLGQYLDIDTNTMYDVKGMYHNYTIQVDVCTDNNFDNELITSAISEGILTDIIVNRGSKFNLYNFIDLSNIKQMGVCKLRNEISITNVEDNSANNDYTTAIRFDIDIIQAIVPEQEFVDLSKWIKIGYKIN